MFRFFLHATALTILLLALFSLAAGFFDFGPTGAMTLLDLRRVPLTLMTGTWALEAFGLIALFLLIEGRTGSRWLDGLLTGWIAWIFRGPLLVVTIVVATGWPQGAWFRLALGWWVLYSVCGLALAMLARPRVRKEPSPPELAATAPEPVLLEPIEKPLEER